MKLLACGVLISTVALAPTAGFSTEAVAVTSEQQACEVLKRAAIELCLSRTNLAGRYYCDPTPEFTAYYVLGLRYEVAPDELVGSNLVGWFGIAKSDGTVANWDITEDRPAPLESGCPFERD